MHNILKLTWVSMREWIVGGISVKARGWVRRMLWYFRQRWWWPGWRPPLLCVSCTAVIWLAAFCLHRHFAEPSVYNLWPQSLCVVNPCLEEELLDSTAVHSSESLGPWQLAGFQRIYLASWISPWCFSWILNFFISSQFCEFFFPLSLNYTWSRIVIIVVFVSVYK